MSHPPTNPVAGIDSGNYTSIPMIDDDKIIQIIPAEGWSALFHRETESCPVACWALTHGGMVRGMIATKGPPHFAEQLEGFDRFQHEREKMRPADH